MRVTQKTMYSSMSGQMNSLLSDYMESNLQGASMKRLNRPSDDPAGAARVINYRSSISRLEQYMANSGTAKGWLSLADTTLTQISSLMTDPVKTLAEQAAQGTYNADQRLSIAAQLREALGTMINLANTQFEGKHIFSGQQYGDSAYEMGLGITSENVLNAPNPPLQVSNGNLARAAMVRFPAIDGTNPPVAGTVPPTAGADGTINPTQYEWSADGGKTWQKATVPVGQNHFIAGGATVTVPPNGDPKNPNVLRPQPYPVGGDSEVSMDTGVTTSAGWNKNIKVNPFGINKATEVRFPNNLDVSTLAPGTAVPCEYSTDGGVTWTNGTATSSRKVTEAFQAGPPPVAGTYETSLGLNLPTGSVNFSTGAYTGKVDMTNPAVPAEDTGAADPARTSFTAGDKVSLSTVTWNNNITIEPSGMTKGTGIRFPKDVDLSTAKSVTYEYSTDGGKTWKEATANVDRTTVRDFDATGTGTAAKYKASLTLKLPTGNVRFNTEEYTGKVDLTDPAKPKEDKTAADPSKVFIAGGNKMSITAETDRGSILTVRPTAIYKGSDDKADPKVLPYGRPSEPLPPNISTSVTGFFAQDVLVQFADNLHGIDMTKDMIPDPDNPGQQIPNTFKYKYSLDGGLTWETGEGTVSSVETQPFTLKGSVTPGDPTATPPVPPVPATDLPEKRTATARLLVPGGYLDLTTDYEYGIKTETSPGVPLVPHENDKTVILPREATVPNTTQLLVKPQRTDLGFEIMEGQYMTVNNVGKNIFGGLYHANYEDTLSPAFGEGDGRNLFETIGRLIGYCENNDIDGIGKCIEDLDTAQKNVLTQNTAIGGKEIRVTATLENLDFNKLDQQTRMSNIEDVNLTDLMLRLSQQQMAYNTVLKSSSMIMQLNLMQYL